MENHDLYGKFRHLGGLLRRTAPRGPEGPWADPSRGQGRILAALKLQDGISSKDLAFILGLRVASLNELVSKLEKAEYVTREQSEEDRRVSLIRLTEKGRAAEQGETEQDAFSVLDEQERKNLGEYLDKVIANLEEQAGPEHAQRFEEWSEKARERMGEEKFEQWMAKFSERFGEEGMARFMQRGGPGFGGRGGRGGPMGRGGRGGRPGFGDRAGFGGRDEHGGFPGGHEFPGGRGERGEFPGGPGARGFEGHDPQDRPFGNADEK